LFFITDKFTSEKTIEAEERQRLKRRLEGERIEEQEKQNKYKRMRTGSASEITTWPPLPSSEKRSPPKYLFKGPKNRGRPPFKPLDFGFFTSST
jgi:hypothetical protein